MKHLLTLLIMLTISYLVSNYAEKRGRDRISWFFFGFFFGLFAFIALYLLPPLNKQKEQSKIGTKDLISNQLNELDPFMSYKWFYLDLNGNQKGPVDSVDLQIAWDDGLINRNSYVWREGMNEWKLIHELNGLENRFQKGAHRREDY